MNTETRRTCVMTFVTSLGGQHNVRIRDPHTGLVTQDVFGASEMLIAANPFDETDVGDLTSLLRAQIITETIQTVL